MPFADMVRTRSNLGPDMVPFTDMAMSSTCFGYANKPRSCTLAPFRGQEGEEGDEDQPERKKPRSANSVKKQKRYGLTIAPRRSRALRRLPQLRLSAGGVPILLSQSWQSGCRVNGIVGSKKGLCINRNYAKNASALNRGP